MQMHSQAIDCALDDTQQVSGAARLLVAHRWGASKPVRMARELAERAAELPEVERRALIAALTRLEAS
jgi:hypothetical protein